MRVSNFNDSFHSLKSGHWFKLICGASYQNLPAIRSLALAYTLGGADCIDVAADPAVITAAMEGIEAAGSMRGGGKPWLMVSVNDGEDPHFRKAAFDETQCPPDCTRPCEQICPANAISDFSGVINERCYGCGRCLPVCPSELIYTKSYVSTPSIITPLIENMTIDALEIHTQVGHGALFQKLWQDISPYCEKLKLLAISCPDGPNLIDYLQSLYQIIAPLPCPLIWQTDGRPMSGDIGPGTTRATIKLAQKVLAAQLPGYVQLAGGTNNTTVDKLKGAGLLQPPTTQLCISGIAYGSYARNLLSPIIDQLETFNSKFDENLRNSPSPLQLEDTPDLLSQAVELARNLILPLKSRRNL